MELPRLGKSDRGMLNNLKSKLGFAAEEPVDDYNDDYGDYDDGYGTYDDYEQSKTVGGKGGFIPAVAHRAAYGSSRSGVSSPRLVSMDDVKARTQIPDSLNRNPLPERRSSALTTGASYSPGAPSRFPRTVERAADYMRSTETSDLPSEEMTAKSSGYDSLFSSTVGTAHRVGSRSYDPYESYAGIGASSHNPTRSLSVLKPVSYGEVERIAKAVKVGDAVILSLRNTPDHLAKRILDFSFGVSSALDASVDCIADKVFAIVKGNALNDGEKMSLRNQGVL